MNIKEDIFYVGVDDTKIDLFEGLYKVPDGVSYNSYVVVDEKVAVLDTVDAHFGDEWLKNIQSVLNGRQPDYLVVHHMEPDHSANIKKFVEKYPDVTVVGNNKTFVMIGEYFGEGFIKNKLEVIDGYTLELGKHSLKFVFAPMVHWPEVMFSYDAQSKVLFSADAFGKFGALSKQDDWVSEARRYYIGIVGKYGVQVQSVLKKLATYEIQAIAPLHGPVLKENIATALDLYTKWSTYTAEENGVLVAYASVYGNTATAAKQLAEKLQANGVKVKVVDLARVDMAECVAQAFAYSKLVLASPTYNAEIFPPVREFLDKLVERNYQNRVVAFIENGTWAPVTAKLMQAKLEKCKNLTYAVATVKIRASLNDESLAQLNALAEELSK